MRGFVGGLVLGIGIGAAAMFGYIERPWNAGSVPLAEALPEKPAPSAQKKNKSGKRRKRKRRRRGEASAPVSGVVELSARDRQAIWRGPTFSLPARSVDFSEGGGGRPMNQSEINQALRGQSSGFTSCISEARGNAELEAQIKLQLLVGGGGGVQKIRVRAPRYLMDHGLHPCISRVARRAAFPATGAPTKVDFPFKLTY